MNFEVFKDTLKEEVQNMFGETGAVLINQVQKVNQSRIGMTIKTDENTVSPMIYLEECYNEFKKGKELFDIAKDIIQILKNSSLNVDSLHSKLMDYEWIKKRLRVKVINQKRNESLLKGVPHEKQLDLALVSYVVLDEDSKMTSLVLDSMVAMWNINPVELLEQAKQNTKVSNSVSIQKMNDFILDMILQSNGCQDEDIIEQELQEMLTMQLQEQEQMDLYIVTNHTKCNGAYVMFQKEVLSQLAGQLGSGLYILPSSVHEILVVSCNGVTAKDLRNMVQDVNQTTVSAEEYLSDSVYYFDPITKELSIALD